VNAIANRDPVGRLANLRIGTRRGAGSPRKNGGLVRRRRSPEGAYFGCHSHCPHYLASQWDDRVSCASGIDVTTPDTAEITGPALTQVFGWYFLARECDRRPRARVAYSESHETTTSRPPADQGRTPSLGRSGGGGGYQANRETADETREAMRSLRRADLGDGGAGPGTTRIQVQKLRQSGTMKLDRGRLVGVRGVEKAANRGGR
jgi:hypothetical protein